MDNDEEPTPNANALVCHESEARSLLRWPRGDMRRGDMRGAAPLLGVLALYDKTNKSACALLVCMLTRLCVFYFSGNRRHMLKQVHEPARLPPVRNAPCAPQLAPRRSLAPIELSLLCATGTQPTLMGDAEVPPPNANALVCQ